MQNVVQDFEMIRSTLRRLFVQGRYEPGAARSEKNRLAILKEVFGPLLRRDGEGWRLEYDPFRQDTNYLYRAYALCALHNKANVVRPALVMQALEEKGEMNPEECACLLSSFARQEALDERPVRATLRRMQRDGRLEKKGDRYRLAPTLPPRPPALSQEEYQEQLSLMTALIPLLADRHLPQSWGYRARDTLRRELERRGWYQPPARPLITQKKHARFQMMLDEGILWKLAEAKAMDRPVRLEIRVSALEKSFVSGPLQPMWTVSDPGMGLTVLVARQTEGEEGPVVLPLEEILRVWPVRAQPGHWLGQEEAREWEGRWFAGSRSGWSPLARNEQGAPCPPDWAEAEFEPEAGIEPERWAHRLPRRPEDEVTVREGRVFLKVNFTRWAEWEWLLFRFEKQLRGLRCSDEAQVRDFEARRKIWKEQGAAPPAPASPWLYPAPAPGRPGGEGEGVELFEPYQNEAVQKALGWIGLACAQKEPLTLDSRELDEDLWDLLSSGELGVLRSAPGRGRWCFEPHIRRPVPSPFTWPEKEWLLGFLRGEGARALLRRDFREGFAAWLEESLARAEQSGLYRPRMTPDFLRIRGQRGNMGLEEESLSPAALALYRGKGLSWQNRVGREEERLIRDEGIPTRLEYEVARSRLYLMAVPLGEPGQELRQVRMQAARLSGLRLMEELPGTPQQQEKAFGWLENKAGREGCRALVRVWKGSEERVCARLRPYAMTTRQSAGGVMRVEISYLPFERQDVWRDLTSLLPAVLPEKEGTDPELLALFEKS